MSPKEQYALDILSGIHTLECAAAAQSYGLYSSVLQTGCCEPLELFSTDGKRTEKDEKTSVSGYFSGLTEVFRSPLK